jgi:hypothetical protein
MPLGLSHAVATYARARLLNQLNLAGVIAGIGEVEQGYVVRRRYGGGAGALAVLLAACGSRGSGCLFVRQQRPHAGKHTDAALKRENLLQ